MSTTTRDSVESNHKDELDSEKDLEHEPAQGPNTQDPEQGNVPSTTPKPASATDWDGPDDPENPLNWPNWVRHYYVVPPALISFVGTFGSSIYTPAYPQIMEQFGVGPTAALLPLSVYVVALGFGPILAAPLSETYGRRFVYLISPPLGALFTVGAGYSTNFASLIICRFFAGMFFSPPLAIGAGTIADTRVAKERASATTLYILSPFLGPALGPVIGSFVAVRKDWQWTQWTIIFFAIFAWISILPMRETYKKTILDRRAKKLGLPAAPSPFPTVGAKIKFLLSVTLIRPLHMLFIEPIVGFLSLYIAFNFAVLFTFFAAFPYIFGTVYHFSTEQSGLVFLALGIGCALAVPTVLFADRFLYHKHYHLSVNEGREGVVAPEHRLYPAMIGSFGLPIGLFWFAWSARSDVHWISPVLATIPFAWGNLSIFIASGMYLIDTYQALNGASAVAANGLLRYVFGAAFPLFTLQMYHALGIAWATSLLGFVTIALMPIPWVLFKYGNKIRSRSAYDTIKA